MPVGCASAAGCNTWTFDAPSHSVVFHGVTCAQLQNAVPQAPVAITIKIFDT